MSNTYRCKPQRERQIEVMKKERGEHRRMEPYKRSAQKNKNWD